MLACSVFHGILLPRSVGLNKCEGRGQAGVDLQRTHIFAATISARIALKGIPSWQLSLEYRSGKSLNPTQCQQYSREISNTQPLFFEGGAACCLFLSNIAAKIWVRCRSTPACPRPSHLFSPTLLESRIPWKYFIRDCKYPRNSVPLVTSRSDSAQYRKNLQDAFKGICIQVQGCSEPTHNYAAS